MSMQSLKHNCGFEILPTWAFAVSPARFYAQKANDVRINLVCTEKEKRKKNIIMSVLLRNFTFEYVVKYLLQYEFTVHLLKWVYHYYACA